MAKIRTINTGQDCASLPEITLEHIRESKPIEEKISNKPSITDDPLTLIEPGKSFSVVTDREFAAIVAHSNRASSI